MIEKVRIARAARNGFLPVLQVMCHMSRRARRFWKRKQTVYFRDTSDAGSGRALALSAATAKEPTMKNAMKKQKNSENPDVERTQPPDEGETHRTGEGTTDMREANENIRKSQGDDAGQRPAIDRHR
jgi:hypothetical protein